LEQRGEKTDRDLPVILQTVRDSAEKVGDQDWTACWKKRLDLFAAAIDHRPVEGKKLEPLFEQYGAMAVHD